MHAHAGPEEPGAALSGVGPRVLAEEQAALRRVAALVADGTPPAEVFAAVTEEIGRLLPVDFAIMGRYEQEGMLTVLAFSGLPVASFPVGSRVSLGGNNVSTRVFETGRPARIDGYSEGSSGAVGAAGRARDVRSTVATPIMVEGRLWGVMIVGTTLEQVLPADSEDRLGSFTGLVATTIANAESGAGLARLAEEQAALRRVATLVARGTPPEDLFAAVVEEVGQLFPVHMAMMGRYEPDGTLVCLATWGRAEHLPPGSRRELGGENLGTIVFETGRSARVDDYADSSSGQLGEVAREARIRSSVATPIMVEGALWGLIAAGSMVEQPLPAESEARLGSFTELVATAIANAESRVALARLAEEQAGLRRVATLVALGVPPEDVFAAVTEEVGQLLPVDLAIMGRFEGDGTGTSVAAWGAPAARFPVGSRWDLVGKNLATTVFETGRPARNDRYAEASGPIGVTGHESGFRSGVATPITVEGSLWGVMVVGSTLEQPLPADIEARLGSFTELVATSIANAESRAALARLAEEQTALRRVATLVAAGAVPEAMFAAVVEEVGLLLPIDLANLCRYEPDHTQTFVATWGRPGKRFPQGSRWPLGGKNLGTMVFETGRSARMEDYSDASGPVSVAARETDLGSGVATPIIVEGRLWGMVAVGSSREDPLPRDTEARLTSFTELVATAIANAESRTALTASRARIVAASDESRRRIERDLHDGAQQRLVHAVIVLKLALRALSAADVSASALVAEGLQHAEEASSELRELAHGILPAALRRGGLRAGVEALISRISLPVSAEVSAERLPDSIEAAAYFVVSEALTNVAKHARADRASVTARVEDGALRVEVSDDGIGGARGGLNTGLGGLEDRVSALDGRLELESPPGAGTRVRAVLPVSADG